jgi:signal peptidase I
MNPTLNDGDILVVNKVCEVNRGDVIIVSNLKSEEDWLVKRVIAIEGDEVVIKDGKVYINGEFLEEDYLLEKNSTYSPNCTDENDIYKQTYHVGENEVFFLGDNRKDSKDGRFYGACSIDNVEGVVSPFFVKIKDVTTSVNKFTMKIKGFFGIDIYGRG